MLLNLNLLPVSSDKFRHQNSMIRKSVGVSGEVGGLHVTFNDLHFPTVQLFSFPHWDQKRHSWVSKRCDTRNDGIRCFRRCKRSGPDSV